MSGPNDALLVRRQWLEKADAKLFKNQPAEVPAGAGNLFYDVRPAVLKSAWSQNAAGLYTATAAFIVNDAVDNSFIFTVDAPTATANPGGEVGTTRFFVVWRGRWEMVGGVRTVTATYATVGGVPVGTVHDPFDYIAAPRTTATSVKLLTGVSIDPNHQNVLDFNTMIFSKRQPYTRQFVSSIE